MAEEIAFWKRPNFQIWSARDLDLDLGSGHTAYYRASLIDLLPNFIETEESFCGRTDVRTYVHTCIRTDGRTGGRTFETGFNRSTLSKSRNNNVNNDCLMSVDSAFHVRDAATEKALSATHSRVWWTVLSFILLYITGVRCYPATVAATVAATIASIITVADQYWVDRQLHRVLLLFGVFTWMGA